MKIGRITSDFRRILVIIILVQNTTCMASLLSYLLDISWPVPHTPEMEEILHESSMHTMEMISLYDYPAEEHIVHTEDGYLLGVHRIPKPDSKKLPILLLHGIASSSMCWVNNCNESLGFILSDEGYDIWLGNLRGNIYSNGHEVLDTTDAAYWNFSLDHLANKDVPAMIDYVLNVTGSSQIFLITYSMGGTASLGTLAAMPEYNKKVRGFVMLAPVATAGYTPSLLYHVATYMKTIITPLLGLFSVNEVMDQTLDGLKLFQHACADPNPTWCLSVLSAMGGYNPYLLNQTRLAVYASHFLQAISIGVLRQYSQIILSKKFPRFDYGEEEDVKTYGMPSPPIYNFSLISAPTAVFWARNDPLSDPVDIALLFKALPNLILKYLVPYPLFSHHNYMWSFNIREKYVNKLIEVLNEFNTTTST